MPPTITDPLYSKQWHLLNTGQMSGGNGARYDINVTKVWDDYTGRDIRVAVADDGIDHTHPDLQANFLPNVSYDVMTGGGGTPVVDEHGTSVAGLIASPLNGVGGVGIAHDAKFAVYWGATTFPSGMDGWIRNAPTWVARDKIDVVNNSWGPMSAAFDGAADQGRYWTAMRDMAANGRDGLGTVVVFAAGNDRDTGFNTNQDPTNNSPWAIQVGALNHDGTYSAYSTPGATVLVGAAGSGNADPSDGPDAYVASMATTDIQGSGGYVEGDYTPGYKADGTYAAFNGTSAAAPVATGVVTLVLDANPRLTYRDVQEILAYSAKQVTPGDAGWSLTKATDWNGGGHFHSYDFGYGGIDALAAVRLAETWRSVGGYKELVQLDGAVQAGSAALSAGQTATVSATFSQHLRVEQMQVSVDIQHADLTKLKIVLVAPGGTESVLMANVPANGTDGQPLPAPLENLSWTFNTVRHWGEDVNGAWTLKVTDADGAPSGTLQSWSIKAMGATASNDDTYVYTNDYARLSAADAGRATLNDTDGGSDVINAAAVSGDSVVNLAPGASGSLGGASFTLGSGTTSVRAVYTGDGDDRVTGHANDELLRAGRGADQLAGGDGADLLYGNQGNDVLYGNQGNDTLQGGQDTDTLFGGQGNDSLDADKGNDVLWGDTGNDFLHGDAGDDTLAGEEGNDTLTGGAGADVFRFDRVTDVDVITDFNVAEGDRIAVIAGRGRLIGEDAQGNATIAFIDQEADRVTLLGVKADQVTSAWFVSV